MGYELFQGYFFCRPEMIGRRNVPQNKLIYLRLLETANRTRVDVEEIAELVREELSVSYRLLRYLNSPVFALAVEVHSIPHALRLLGEKLIQKWISLVCIASLGDDKPGELARVPLIRARFCELLAEASTKHFDSHQLFLLGLLSVLDALVNMPMIEVLANLPVDQEIKKVLRGQATELNEIFDIVLDYESGSWDQLAATARSAQVEEKVIPGLYLQALAWVEQIVSQPARVAG
jgi:EAL and modified HD-GYP domain-containing signal transduction protein